MFNKCLSCSNWFCLSRKQKVGTCVLIGSDLCRHNTFRNPHLLFVRLKETRMNFWRLVGQSDYWFYDSVVIKPLLGLLEGLPNKQLKE